MALSCPAWAEGMAATDSMGTEASTFVCAQLAVLHTVCHDSRQNGKFLFVLDHLLKTPGRWRMRMEGKEYGLSVLSGLK